MNKKKLMDLPQLILEEINWWVWRDKIDLLHKEYNRTFTLDDDNRLMKKRAHYIELAANYRELGNTLYFQHRIFKIRHLRDSFVFIPKRYHYSIGFNHPNAFKNE